MKVIDMQKMQQTLGSYKVNVILIKRDYLKDPNQCPCVKRSIYVEQNFRIL